VLFENAWLLCKHNVTDIDPEREVRSRVERRIDIDEPHPPGVSLEKSGEHELIVTPDQAITVVCGSLASTEERPVIALACSARPGHSLYNLEGNAHMLNGRRLAVPI